MSVQVTSINHIGLHVNDIEKAIEFYKNAMGWTHLAGPWPIKDDGSEKWAFTTSIYGKEGNTWEGFKLAHMLAGNDVGVELLQFENGYAPAKHLEFKRQGIFHFAITVDDLDAFVENFIAYGGKQYSDKRYDPRNFGTVFMEDPFGNVFECHNASYAAMNKMG